MRTKIIAVNAVIVLVVGLLAFAIVKTQLGLATSSTDQLKRTAQRDAASVASKLQLDALRAERWLAVKAAEPSTRALLTKATPDARSDAARQLADQVANAAPGALGEKPSIVAVIDSNGKMLSRNGSDLGRGDDVAGVYPAFKDALAKAAPGSDVWTAAKRADQYIASYVPVHDENNRVMMLLLGVALNDALAHVTEASAGKGLLLVDHNSDVLASTQTTEDAKKAVKDAAADVKRAIASGVAFAGGADVLFAVAPLDGFGAKTSAVVAIAPTTLLDGVTGAAYSVLGAMLLGLVLVVAGGYVLGGYIAQPIAALEEGLLAILNGQSDKRFELDHAELGGLAFRIDQLLNQLMGVEEDNTDDQGRISKAPSPVAFGESYAVDRSAQDASAAPAGPAESAEQYHARLYQEYVSAKRSVGEPVDHITSAMFRARIQDMEQEASSKHGHPVRYKVQVNGREVVLLAVPV
jgi:hypothetical protein